MVIMTQSLDLMRVRLRALKPMLCDQFGVSGLAIFGSYARNQADASSDLDLLVDFDRTPSLFELARMDQTIEQALSVKIDTVPRGSLNPRYAPFIIQELIPV